MQPENIQIVGAGAIGQLYGVKLSKYAAVSFYGRKGNCAASFQLQTLDGHTLSWNSNLENVERPATLLMICCKSYQTEHAFSPFREKLAADTPILLMQNGMGSEQLLGEVPNPILKASITHGAMRLSSHISQHTGRGATEVGLLSGEYSDQRKEQLITLLNQAIPPVSWNNDIQTTLWKKLIVNAAINPLTALYRVKNGELLAPKYINQLNGLVKEAVELAHAEKICLETEVMQQLVHQVAKTTARNRSSMLQDIEAGRKTEVEFITGYLLKTAARHKRALPMNQAMYEELSAIGG